MRPAIAILALLLATTSATAAPHVRRDGANHHLGDDSFVARFGRPPTDGDDEPLRMRVHLAYVREVLASRPATAPELANRRAELLGYLGDYIAKGITPVNTYVPRRNPVFIDATGNICAVGYLIERSVGRALPETIAATHRLDYLEDIAAAMPEVASWVATSGFTLDELASIQPGYPGPEVMHLEGWLAANADGEAIGEALPADGPYQRDEGGTRLIGKFERKQMVGAWTRKREGKLLGTGRFTAGAGTWTSFRLDGTRLAVGPFVNSHAHGTWRVFHRSGHLAAVGTMRRGKRHGTWTFFYDNPRRSKLAVGEFAAGETLGGWKHFDEHGKLIATVNGRAWAGITIAIVPNAAGVRHEIHQGIPAERHRLDGFYLGKDKLYIDEVGVMYDGAGNQLEKTETGWVARACMTWPKQRKAAARAGDVASLHASLLNRRWDDERAEVCTGERRPVGTVRAKRYEAMIASRAQLLAPIPAWDIDPQPATPVADDDPEDDEPEDDFEVEERARAVGTDNPDDLATYVTRNATWYIEFPHVDDTFRAVYRSLPGYAPFES